MLRSRCDKDCFHHLTIALHLSLCCESDVHESVFMSLSFRFLLTVPFIGDEGALSFCDQKTAESRESALVAGRAGGRTGGRTDGRVNKRTTESIN